MSKDSRKILGENKNVPLANDVEGVLKEQTEEITKSIEIRKNLLDQQKEAELREPGGKESSDLIERTDQLERAIYQGERVVYFCIRVLASLRHRMPEQDILKITKTFKSILTEGLGGDPIIVGRNIEKIKQKAESIIAIAEEMNLPDRKLDDPRFRVENMIGQLSNLQEQIGQLRADLAGTNDDIKKQSGSTIKLAESVDIFKNDTFNRLNGHDGVLGALIAKQEDLQKKIESLLSQKGKAVADPETLDKMEQQIAELSTSIDNLADLRDDVRKANQSVATLSTEFKKDQERQDDRTKNIEQWISSNVIIKSEEPESKPEPELKKVTMEVAKEVLEPKKVEKSVQQDATFACSRLMDRSRFAKAMAANRTLDSDSLVKKNVNNEMEVQTQTLANVLNFLTAAPMHDKISSADASVAPSDNIIARQFRAILPEIAGENMELEIDRNISSVDKAFKEIKEICEKKSSKEAIGSIKKAIGFSTSVIGILYGKTNEQAVKMASVLSPEEFLRLVAATGSRAAGLQNPEAVFDNISVLNLTNNPFLATIAESAAKADDKKIIRSLYFITSQRTVSGIGSCAKYSERDVMQAIVRGLKDHYNKLVRQESQHKTKADRENAQKQKITFLNRAGNRFGSAVTDTTVELSSQQKGRRVKPEETERNGGLYRSYITTITAIANIIRTEDPTRASRRNKNTSLADAIVSDVTEQDAQEWHTRVMTQHPSIGTHTAKERVKRREISTKVSAR